MSDTCKDCEHWEFELSESAHVCGDVYGTCEVYCGFLNAELDDKFGTSPGKYDWPEIVYTSKSDYHCKAFSKRVRSDG